MLAAVLHDTVYRASGCLAAAAGASSITVHEWKKKNKNLQALSAYVQFWVLSPCWHVKLDFALDYWNQIPYRVCRGKQYGPYWCLYVSLQKKKKLTVSEYPNWHI